MSYRTTFCSFWELNWCLLDKRGYPIQLLDECVSIYNGIIDILEIKRDATWKLLKKSPCKIRLYNTRIEWREHDKGQIIKIDNNYIRYDCSYRYNQAKLCYDCYQYVVSKLKK